MFCLIVLLLITRHSSLVTEVRAEDRFSIKYQHYEDDKSIYYEDTNGVISDRWLVALTKFITEKTSLALNYGVDAISSASWKIDGVTSATRRGRAGEEDRHSGSIGINHTVGTANISVTGGLSRENNYNSDYLAASIGKEFNKRNTNLTLSVSKAWDDVYSTKVGDPRDYPESKDTTTIGMSLAQTLTPWTVAAIGHEYTIVDGYQAHPENVVMLSDGTFTDEIHPESRHRNASVLRINQYLPWKAAVHADYRYYTDSWGVDSHTYGLKYYQYLYDDLILRLRGRYYSQGAADFYSEDPSPSDRFPTIDGKLREFDSITYGAKMIYDITKLANKIGLKAAEKVNLDLKYDRYEQVDAITSATGKEGSGLKADIIQLGLGMEF
jgi:hypothetical protein